MAFLALLLTGFNAMLSPLKKDIARLDKRMDKMETSLLELKALIIEKKT